LILIIITIGVVNFDDPGITPVPLLDNATSEKILQYEGRKDSASLEIAIWHKNGEMTVYICQCRKDEWRTLDVECDVIPHIYIQMFLIVNDSSPPHNKADDSTRYLLPIYSGCQRLLEIYKRLVVSSYPNCYPI